MSEDIGHNVPEYALSDNVTEYFSTIADTAQGKDAPRGNFLMLYAEY